MTHQLRLAWIVFVAAAHAPAAFAYSVVVSLEALLAESQVVVLADVVSVVASGEGRDQFHVATARVVETWKGPVRSEVQFIASPGWFMCDTSNAREGETVVLFLDKAENEPRPRIAHFGRGRMPIGTIGGTRAALLYEVTLPSSLSVIRETKYPRREGIGLTMLKSYVRHHASGPEV